MAPTKLDDRPAIEALIRSTPPEKAQALQEQLDDAARSIHRALAKLALAEDEPDEVVTRARDTLTRSADLAIAPLIEIGAIPAPARAFAMRTVVAASIALKARVAAWAEGALEDREELPYLPPGESEEGEPHERVCDVAVLALRRIGHFGEDGRPADDAERAFLKLAFDKRDKVIAKLRSERRWDMNRTDLEGASR